MYGNKIVKVRRRTHKPNCIKGNANVRQDFSLPVHFLRHDFHLEYWKVLEVSLGRELPRLIHFLDAPNRDTAPSLNIYFSISFFDFVPCNWYLLVVVCARISKIESSGKFIFQTQISSCASKLLQFDWKINCFQQIFFCERIKLLLRENYRCRWRSCKNNKRSRVFVLICNVLIACNYLKQISPGTIGTVEKLHSFEWNVLRERGARK